MIRDHTSATESHKRGLKIRQKILGEDHENTADSHHNFWCNQYMLNDYVLATESHKRALKIRQKVLGEDHEKTAESYHNWGATQTGLARGRERHFRTACVAEMPIRN